MRHIYIKIIFLLVLIFTIGACEEEDNLQPEGQWELSTPSAVTPQSNEQIVLEENNTNELITFSWTEATSSAGYDVYYSVLIVDGENPNYTNPIMDIEAENSGKDLSATVSYGDLDTALSLAGYAANSNANLIWAAVAQSLSKEEMGISNLIVKRFENEIIPTQLFLSGTATENGNDISNAIPLRRLNNSEGNPSNNYEMYTSLTAGNTFMFYSEQSLPAHKYGGAEDVLVKNGNPISVTEDGQYRISVDLDNNTYSLLKINTWNVKGSPIIGGWDSDEPLAYIGGGVWQASMDLVETGGFLFRADVPSGDYWSYLMKRVVGTPNEVIMESQAASQGLLYEDIPSEEKGTMIVTLDLSSNAYTYTIEKDPNVAEPIETPETLFLFVNNTMVEELTKDGDVFNASNYLALQTSDVVSFNVASDGSGNGYTIFSSIGVTDTPDDAKVIANAEISNGNDEISVERDQAYNFSIDFSSAKLTWSYYNITLFHWDELNQKWDDRNEYLMTYVHPYKFTTSASLKANFDMKFFSPWDNDFGADNPSALNGTMTNHGGSNFKNTTIDGTYTVSIEVTNDYLTGTYNFEL
ncbi:SusE domain-containing protein [Formosa sp. PL04]|uniref:SusE domain-containing protein n=1 Tax=Formosa sp. PL04 TaxID=3081755 RepID=UPI002980B300|nr:SusF/SusE family outer membrane protein [Formosa sp. PL04]MDW5288907.1 SusF/SusE family outer membrane protein [Formosa sp. PL04]